MGQQDDSYDYTLHINFSAPNDDVALAIGEDSRNLLAVSLDVEFSQDTGEWDVSGKDEAGNLDWSTIIRREVKQHG